MGHLIVVTSVVCQLAGTAAPVGFVRPPGVALDGRWNVTRMEFDDATLEVDHNHERTFAMSLEFSGKKATLRVKSVVLALDDKVGSLEVDASVSPKSITIVFDPEGSPARLEGIFKQQGERLVICLAPAGRERPKTFTAKGHGGHVLLELRKAKP